MATSFTAVLRNQLIQLAEDPANFAAEFDRWKAEGEAGEFDSLLFGKDSAYIAPAVAGLPNVLRHVHLVPLFDARTKELWIKRWQRRSRKTSDRALVYVSDQAHGHLLIYILQEPLAHEIASMKTPEHWRLMHQFAKVAEHFIQTGRIIA